jgi:prolyl-tRNA editing enzyme YbaK/EbsC (Cys-tRNA(Pro) deacylase)
MANQPLTPDDLERYVAEHGIQAEMLRLPEETPTVEEAARVLGCATSQVVKSLLFVVNDAPYLCIACGTGPVSRRKLAARLGVSRKRVRLADAETVLGLTGYAVGTVPAFGHTGADVLTVFIDPRVLEQAVVYAGGGGIAAMVRIRAEDIQAHLQAEVLDLLDDA